MNSVTQEPEIRVKTDALPVLKPAFNRAVFDRKVDFTKSFAQTLIEMPTVVGERPLRSAWVDYLVTQAKGGTFLFDAAEVITCVLDGVTYRLNGQHTCWMRQYMPDDWDHQIRHIKYEVDTEEQMRKIYATIDRGAPRTAGHVINARLQGTDGYKDFSSNVIKMLAEGFRNYLGDVRVDAVADKMVGNDRDLCGKVASILIKNGITSRRSSHLSRAAVIAAIFATTKLCERDSETFWAQVADGIELKGTDPSYHLRKWLLDVSPNVGRGATPSRKEIVSNDDIYGRCIAAWNTYRDDLKAGVNSSMKQLKRSGARSGRRPAAR